PLPPLDGRPQPVVARTVRVRHPEPRYRTGLRRKNRPRSMALHTGAELHRQRGDALERLAVELSRIRAVYEESGPRAVVSPEVRAADPRTGGTGARDASEAASRVGPRLGSARTDLPEQGDARSPGRREPVP